MTANTKKKAYWAIFILFAIATTVSVIYFARQPLEITRVVVHKEKPSAESDFMPADSLKGWKTYRNERYGYEIQVPNNWKVGEVIDEEQFGITYKISNDPNEYFWQVFSIFRLPEVEYQKRELEFVQSVDGDPFPYEYLNTKNNEAYLIVYSQDRPSGINLDKDELNKIFKTFKFTE